MKGHDIKQYSGQYFERFTNHSKKQWNSINLVLEQTKNKSLIVQDVDGKPNEGDKNVEKTLQNLLKPTQVKPKVNSDV